MIAAAAHRAEQHVNRRRVERSLHFEQVGHAVLAWICRNERCEVHRREPEPHVRKCTIRIDTSVGKVRHVERVKVEDRRNARAQTVTVTVRRIVLGDAVGGCQLAPPSHLGTVAAGYATRSASRGYTNPHQSCE